MLLGPKILVLFVIAIGIILFQIFLSKRDGKWFGLILPIISFVISLILVVSIIAYTNIGITSHSISEEGIIIMHEIEDTKPTFDMAVEQVVITFLLSNIPTVVLIVIYAACREKRKRVLEIEKMQIQDIE